MHASLVIAAKDLRLRLRDRSAIVLAFVAPVLLAFIITAAVGRPDGPLQARFVVADLDGSTIARTFVETVLGSDQVRRIATISPVADADAARQAVENGRAHAAFVVPDGYAMALQEGSEATITVIAGADRPIAGQVAEAIARGFTERVAATRLSVLTALQAGAALDQIQALAGQAAEQEPAVSLAGQDAGGRTAGMGNYFGPAMALLFVFFTVGFGARGILTERTAGTLARLVAAPIRPWSVLVGKTIPVLVLGLASMGVMFVSMGLAFGTSWGDPLAVVALSVAIVVAAFGITAAVQIVARTDEQAGTYASVVVILLALLGGNFFPAYMLPDLMRRLTLLTPNGWALRGYTDVAFDGATIIDVLPHLAAISAFSLVCLAFALPRARRMVSA